MRRKKKVFDKTLKSYVQNCILEKWKIPIKNNKNIIFFLKITKKVSLFFQQPFTTSREKHTTILSKYICYIFFLHLENLKICWAFDLFNHFRNIINNWENFLQIFRFSKCKKRYKSCLKKHTTIYMLIIKIHFL